MTPFEGTSTCIETARPLQLLEVLSSACALVFLSSRSLTSLQTSGGPLTSSRITPDSLLPFVHHPPLSSPDFVACILCTYIYICNMYKRYIYIYNVICMYKCCPVERPQTESTHIRAHICEHMHMISHICEKPHESTHSTRIPSNVQQKAEAFCASLCSRKAHLRSQEACMCCNQLAAT